MKKYYKKHFNQIWSSLKNIWLSFNNQSLFIKVGCVIAFLSAIIGTIVIVLFLQLKRIEKTISSPNNTYLIATLYIQQQLSQTRNDLKINNKIAYYVIGAKDIKQTFPKTNIIRKIEAIKGKLLLDELLVMMDEYFVKNKELTVLPYPLKYLREFREMIKICNMKFKN